MDYEAIEQKVRQVLFNKALVDITNGQNCTSSYFIKSLTGKEDALVSHIHATALRDGSRAGIISQNEWAEELEKRRLWTQEEEIEIESLKRGILRMKNMLPSYKFQKAKWHQVNNRLKAAQRELNELEETKRDLFLNCLEYRAQEVRYRKIAFFCLETIDEQPFWTETEFADWTDFRFIFNVTEAYIASFVLDEKTIREIARSPSWRYRWLATKNGADLFGKPASEWSQAQNGLVYWSLYYDGIFEDPDCPHQIVGDDEALDNWLKQRNRERDQKKDVYKNSKSKPGKKMSKGLQEVFIFADRGDQETIDEIQSMNDPGTRARLRAERQMMEEKGMVTEWELRKGMHTRPGD